VYTKNDNSWAYVQISTALLEQFEMP